MRSLRVLLCAAIVAALVPVAAAADSARIVVYLPWDSLQRSRNTIFDEKSRVAEVKPGRFFVMNVEPGPHVLIAGDGMPLVVSPHANQATFVRVTRVISFERSGKVDMPALELRSKEEGEFDLRFLVYISPKEIFSSCVSKQDPLLHQKPKLKPRQSNP